MLHQHMYQQDNYPNYWSQYLYLNTKVKDKIYTMPKSYIGCNFVAELWEHYILFGMI